MNKGRRDVWVAALLLLVSVCMGLVAVERAIIEITGEGEPRLLGFCTSNGSFSVTVLGRTTPLFGIPQVR